MSELAGTAAAVIGTITTASGALLAGIVDPTIDGSLTPLAIVYGALRAGSPAAPAPTNVRMLGMDPALPEIQREMARCQLSFCQPVDT